jgi:hypothetical protein
MADPQQPHFADGQDPLASLMTNPKFQSVGPEVQHYLVTRLRTVPPEVQKYYAQQANAAAAPPQGPGYVHEGLAGLWDFAKGMGQYGVAGMRAATLDPLTLHPEAADVGKQAFQAQQQEFQQPGWQHKFAGSVPLIGPPVAQLAQQMSGPGVPGPQRLRAATGLAAMLLMGAKGAREGGTPNTGLRAATESDMTPIGPGSGEVPKGLPANLQPQPGGTPLQKFYEQQQLAQAKMLGRGSLITPLPERVAAGTQPTGPWAYPSQGPQPEGAYLGSALPADSGEYGPLEMRPQKAIPPTGTPQANIGREAIGHRTMAPQQGSAKAGLAGPPRVETPASGNLPTQGQLPPDIQNRVSLMEAAMSKYLAIKPPQGTPEFERWQANYTRIKAQRDALLAQQHAPAPKPMPEPVGLGEEQAHRAAEPVGQTGAMKAAERPPIPAQQGPIAVARPEPVSTLPTDQPPAIASANATAPKPVEVAPKLGTPPSMGSPVAAAFDQKALKAELLEAAKQSRAVRDAAGAAKLARARMWNVDIHELQPGESPKIPATYSDYTVRSSAIKRANGEWQEGPSGSYDTILNTGAAAEGINLGGRGIPMAPGDTLYVFDKEDAGTPRVRIYRMGGAPLERVARPALSPKPAEALPAVAPPEITAKTPYNPSWTPEQVSQWAELKMAADRQTPEQAASAAKLGELGKRPIDQGDATPVAKPTMTLAREAPVDVQPKPQRTPRVPKQAAEAKTISPVEIARRQLQAFTKDPQRAIAGTAKDILRETTGIQFRDDPAGRFEDIQKLTDWVREKSAKPSEAGAIQFGRGEAPADAPKPGAAERDIAERATPWLAEKVAGSLRPYKDAPQVATKVLKWAAGALQPKALATETQLDVLYKDVVGPRVRSSETISQYFKEFPLLVSKGEAGKWQTIKAAISHSDRVLANLEDWFHKMPTHEQVDFVDRIKTGTRQRTVPLQQVADFMRKLDDDLYAQRKELWPGSTYKPNHFEIVWSDKLKHGLSGVRPLKGKGLAFHQQVLPTMSAGLELGKEPVTYNPITMFKATYADSMKAITTERFLREGKALDMVRELDTKERTLPDGFVRLKDPFPTKYIVQEDLARLLQNYVSPSPYQYAAYRAVMNLKNAATGIELAGPFHALTTITQSMGADFGYGAREFWNEGIRELDATKMVSGLKKMVMAPTAPGRLFTQGNKLFREFKNAQELIDNQGLGDFVKAHPQTAELLNDFFTGGGKFSINEEYKLNSYKMMKRAWENNNVPLAALHGVLMPIQAAMKPLFEYYIPRIKWGAWTEDYARSLGERDVQLSEGTVSRETLAREAWDRTENMFGEMNLDLQFWNRSLKGGFLVFYRSVGWRLGNLKLVGEGIANQTRAVYAATKVIKDLWSGDMPRTSKNYAKMLPEVDASSAHLLGNAVATAAISSLVMYWFTGKWPTSALDYIRPQIGGVDDRGKPHRATLPLYSSRDIPQMFDAPAGYLTGGTSATVQRFEDIMNNKDFTGTEVYSPTEPAYKKVAHSVEHMVPTPIWVQNYKQLNAGNTKLEKFFASTALGVAPRKFDNTTAENFFLEQDIGGLPARGRDQASVDRSNARRQLITMLRNGQRQAAAQFAREKEKAGVIKPQDFHSALSVATKPYIVTLAERLPVDTLIAGWSKATPAERKELAPVLHKAAVRKSTLPEQKKTAFALLREVYK